MPDPAAAAFSLGAIADDLHAKVSTFKLAKDQGSALVELGPAGRKAA